MGLATPLARAPSDKDGSNSQLLRKGPQAFLCGQFCPSRSIQNLVQRSAGARINGD